MYTEFTRFVIAGCHHAAAFRRAADGYGLAAQGRVVAHFDGGVETVAVAMNYFSLSRLFLRA
jgi:hypothetical protein